MHRNSLFTTSFNSLSKQLGHLRVRVLAKAHRLAIAWSFFTGRLSAADAHTILIECEACAGAYPLLVLTTEDTLAQALEMFEPHPTLTTLIDEACCRVSRKWESYNDELYEARRWAIELAEGYAADEGVMLVRLSRNAALD